MKTLSSSRLLRLASLCSFAITASATLAQAPLPSAPHKAPLLLGAAWYPEQWPESRWDADLELMQKAHINFVRIGEFAWSTMEPSEGNFQMDWLEHAIRHAEKHGIAIVLGTPTAAPPAWLTSKYPQTLRTEQNGRKDEHGGRQQFNWGDPTYRKFAYRVAEQMSKRFGHDPDVIGWQIDNEYAAESYGLDDRARFQEWLKAKYKTLDNLNARWTTAYWSETMQQWTDIPIQTSGGNPGLMLNWQEFVSDTWRSYQKNQLDAIRAHAEPRQAITTNMMGWFDGYDHYTVSKDLDFASWDDYVGTGQLNLTRNGMAHDLTRGYLRKNFWVMETQPGFVNWQTDNNTLNKGEVRAMAWHAIGHGAEAVEYWQWRSDLNGQEQYHGTLVGADGTPVPLYAEVAQVGAEFDKTAKALEGTTVASDVAILMDFNSRWAINWQRHNKAFDPVAELESFYAPVRQAMRSVDVVGDTAPLSGYRLVFAPGLNVLTPEAVKNLEAYVRGGGNLVFGTRSAMKDQDNTLFPQRQPGPFADMLGARVEQFYALDKDVPVSGDWGAGISSQWAEQISVTSPDTEVLARYGKSNGWLDGQPAAVTRRVGKGSITYIGASLDEASMVRMAQWAIARAGLKPVMPDVPAAVDVAIRSGAGKRIVLLTNYAEQPQTVALPVSMTDLLNGGSVGSVTLPQYGVAVLEERR